METETQRTYATPAYAHADVSITYSDKEGIRRETSKVTLAYSIRGNQITYGVGFKAPHDNTYRKRGRDVSTGRLEKSPTTCAYDESKSPLKNVMDDIERGGTRLPVYWLNLTFT